MSILIATPMYGSMCHAQHFNSCLNLKEDFLRAGMEHEWLITTHESLITRARNTSARTFLETSYQKLMFIDGDIEFTSDDVALLWNLEVPVAVGLYRMKAEGAKLAAWKGGRLCDITTSEPFTVDYAGTGFMLIDRSVLETLKERVGEYDEAIGNDPDIRAYKPTWGFFQDPIIEHPAGGKYHQSEDYFFCEQWRAAGGEIWAHPQCQLVHWGQRGY